MLLIPFLLMALALPSPPVSVMSFNIRYGTAKDMENAWPNRRDQVFALLRREAPDLLGVQEALRFQLDELHQAVPGYGEVGVGRADGDTAGEYAAILYRRARFTVADSGWFWLSDTPGVPGSMSWGNRITRICTWARLVDRETGDTIRFYTLHLDHESQPSRVASAARVARHIEEGGGPANVILTGDFNAGPGNEAIGLIRDSLGLVDTWEKKHRDSLPAGTFHAFSGGETGDRIDYVFVSTDFAVLSAEIRHDSERGRWPSDHFPVTAEVNYAHGRKQGTGNRE